MKKQKRKAPEPPEAKTARSPRGREALEDQDRQREPFLYARFGPGPCGGCGLPLDDCTCN